MCYGAEKATDMVEKAREKRFGLPAKGASRRNRFFLETAALSTACPSSANRPHPFLRLFAFAFFSGGCRMPGADGLWNVAGKGLGVRDGEVLFSISCSSRARCPMLRDAERMLY